MIVIGAKNSAAIAALELWRHGARVTLVHRGPAIHQNVKYWIKPDIENRIKNGEITALFQHDGEGNHAHDGRVARRRHDELTLKNDFVLALTGYPSRPRLSPPGRVQIGEPPECRPNVNPKRWRATSQAYILPASSLQETVLPRSSSRMAGFTAARSPQISGVSWAAAASQAHPYGQSRIGRDSSRPSDGVRLR